MDGRAEFLRNIRRRTRPGEYRPTLAPDSVWTTKEPAPRPEPIEDPPARFLKELEAVGGHGSRAADGEEARGYVVDLARERGAKLWAWTGRSRTLASRSLSGGGFRISGR